MNRAETQQLLRRRHDLTGDNFGASMLDTWHEMLATTPYGEAVVALNRTATKHGTVRWHDFHAELAAHRNAKTNRGDLEPVDCGLCGGTGWKDTGPDRGGNTSVEPCESHVRPGPIVTPGQGITAAITALEQEMRARGRNSHDIDTVINRWFTTEEPT